MSQHDDTQNERSLEPVKNAVLGIETVNARRLHTFLEVGKDFSTWLRDRVEQYGFVEGADFVLLPKSGENSGRGQPAKEYAISLDMAKELSMVERNEKGKQARRYFIDCERRAKAATDPMAVATALNDPAALRTLLLENVEERLKLAKQVAEAAPKVEAFDRIANTDGVFTSTDAAKTLGVPPGKLRLWMRMNKWVYRRLGTSDDVAYEDKLTSGVLVHKSQTVQRLDGTEKVITRARITPKGLAKLALAFGVTPPSFA